MHDALFTIQINYIQVSWDCNYRSQTSEDLHPYVCRR